MPELIIPCLTLWQPWASAMAEGLKRIETRDYSASRLGLQPGQLVAVHAAKRPMTDEDWELWDATKLTELDPDIPYGAVLSVHRYEVSCLTKRICLYPERYELTEQEERFGDYSDGRWGWLMPLALKLDTPIPHRGQQGIGKWRVPDEVQALLGMPAEAREKLAAAQMSLF